MVKSVTVISALGLNFPLNLLKKKLTLLLAHHSLLPHRVILNGGVVIFQNLKVRQWFEIIFLKSPIGFGSTTGQEPSPSI